MMKVVRKQNSKNGANTKEETDSQERSCGP